MDKIKARQDEAIRLAEEERGKLSEPREYVSSASGDQETGIRSQTALEHEIEDLRSGNAFLCRELEELKDAHRRLEEQAAKYARDAAAAESNELEALRMCKELYGKLAERL